MELPRNLLFLGAMAFLLLSRWPSMVVAAHAKARILASAPAPSARAQPSNLTVLMSRKGCKAFAALLSSIPNVQSTFDGDVTGGLTIFCPSDRAVAAFMPHYKNLTADGKASLLLYHGVPVYSSLDTLKTSNGELNTLATGGTAQNYNFTVQDQGEVVTLKTGITTAAITGTVVDRSPLAIYTVDDVLQPTELFKVSEPPSPAPAPAPAHKKKKKKGAASPPAPAGPEAAPADQKAADVKAAAVAVSGGQWVVAVTVGAAVAWIAGV